MTGHGMGADKFLNGWLCLYGGCQMGREPGQSRSFLSCPDEE